MLELFYNIVYIDTFLVGIDFSAINRCYFFPQNVTSVEPKISSFLAVDDGLERVTQ